MPKVSEAHLEMRRAEIVKAAAEIFAERGYGAAHMRDVAKRAGLSTGAVYRYFPGKEELFRAVVETDQPLEDRRTLEYLEGETPLERLEHLLVQMVERTPTIGPQVRKNFRGYGEASQVPFLADELSRYATRVIDQVVGIVREAQAAGDIDPELEAHAVARTLTSQFVAIGFSWLFLGEYDVAAVREVFLRMLAGLRPPGAPSTGTP